MKIIYENCGVKNYMEQDHRSYRRNFCSCEEKARNEFVRFSFRNYKSSVYNCDDLLSTLSCNYSACLQTSSTYQTTYSGPPENVKYRVMQQLLRQSSFFVVFILSPIKRPSDLDDAPGRRLFCCFIEKKPTRVS